MGEQRAMNRIWRCIYCGFNLNLDKRDKKTFIVNGKKHKKNTRDYCSITCMKYNQEFKKTIQRKNKEELPEIRAKVQEVLWRQISRIPTKILNRELILYSKGKLIQAVQVRSM